MRLAVALLTLVLSASNMPGGHLAQPQARVIPLVAPEQISTADSPMEYLLTSAAKDFHAHPNPLPAGFRKVRFGHVMIPDGARQYRLCGEFLPQQKDGKAEWMSFATIKTSGYEQYIGTQAESFCQTGQFVRDTNEDLSAELQSRLDSLH